MHTLSNSEITDIRLQMIKFATLQLSDPDLAEDIVQEALASAYKHAGTFRGQSALKTWIFAILKNKIIDALKIRKRTVVLSDITESDNTEQFFDQHGHWGEKDLVSEWRNIQSAVYQKEFWAIFNICLDHLPARQAKIFMMRTHLELTSEEICQECNISVNNLNVILYRARVQLQRCLSKNWFDEET
ncbi:RNA polymerase sigma factor [[Actinobacillus] muris]|uniref:RNA polymerase sigma factor n=1 Tax=Muribacter muris TaxID=67855 RepID=A0A0J5P6N3_9PAST|nr:sigma-70 family RNA polymerase sigma factor [Muribacter muris]KMK51425.1 RNA polymerase sigma factor [[Actinobacillus] muris] [Muribacter muris]MBF0784981.1 sigma-70 family RNA polymerase sigma factor [Muribacter muris]MBF0827289.1 sigma-70 family RNA polymerase sigma factor [Muribacter muris]TFV10898.1 sigma-70 family RNA polymerase sigma factor [Muribacter muris]